MCSIKKVVPKNFAVFTGKLLRSSLFLIKLNTYFQEHLRTAASVTKRLMFFLTYHSSQIFVYTLNQTEAATRSVLSSDVFLVISQNSHENACARVSFLIKLQGLDLQLY